jgi:carbamoyl-phosphate synthase large subunit
MGHRPRDDAGFLPPLNVLLTSIGRRVALARAFRKELAAYAPGSRLLGADLSSLSAGFQDADGGFLVTRCTDPDYVTQLLEIVHREKVRIVVPLIDTELGILARSRDAFLREGCHVIVSDEEQVLVTRDKARTAEHFRRLGFDAPRVFTDDELGDLDRLSYPVFLKPACGSSSIGAMRIDDPAAMRYHLARTDSPVVQSYVEGEEFTIDVFCDLEGAARCAVPRKRLETRAGEVSKGVTVKDRAMMHAASRLVEALGGCRGCITLQCFRCEGRYVFFEANLRFGGGYPLTYAAGANFPGWILRMVSGEHIAPFDAWEDGLLMLRFDEAVFVRGCRE